jgi:hypothetical protein
MGESNEASYRRAVDNYTKLINDNPQFAEAFEGRGNAYVGLKNYDKAEQDFREAVTIKSDYAEAWKDLGSVYKQKNDLDQALTAYSQAIHYKSNYVDAYFGRGDTYTAKGGEASYDLAIADYTRIIATTQSAEAYYKRGLTYKAKGDKPNALADFKQAIDRADDLTTRANALQNWQQLGGPQNMTPADPSIYIQYNDPDDEDVINKVAEDLRANSYHVVGQPQLSGGNAIGNGDVRCFHTVDLSSAKKIAALVQESILKHVPDKTDKTINARDLKDYPDVPLGQIEVWIASLKLANVPAKEAPRSASVR